MFAGVQCTTSVTNKTELCPVTSVSGFGAIFSPVGSNTIVVCKNNTRFLGSWLVSGKKNIRNLFHCTIS